MKKLWNPASAALYVVLNSLSLFVVYKRLTQDLGVELFGLWSFALTLQVSFPIFFTGFLGTLIRYIPEFIAKNELIQMKVLVGTSFTCIISITTFLSAFLHLAFPYAAHHIWHNQLLLILSSSEGTILLYVLSSCISLGLLSILEGHNKVYIKNIVLCCQATALYVCVLLNQSTFTFASTANMFMWISFGTCLCSFIALPLFTSIRLWDLFQFSRQSLELTSGYRSHYFKSNVYGLLLEPINKTLIVLFAGPSVVALYELSSKFVIQARTVLVSVTFSLIPTFSKKSILQPELLIDYYRILFKINTLTSVFTFSCLALILPSLSFYWFDKINFIFLQMACILIIGWYLNNLCLPAYTMNAATNGIRLNTIASREILLVDLVLGLFLGLMGAKELVVIAWLISLAYGGFRLIFLFNHTNHVSLQTLLRPKDYLQIVLMMTLVLVLLFALTVSPPTDLFHAINISSIGIAICGLVVLIMNKVTLVALVEKLRNGV